jgi:hypothetical protein
VSKCLSEEKKRRKEEKKKRRKEDTPGTQFPAPISRFNAVVVDTSDAIRYKILPYK